MSVIVVSAADELYAGLFLDLVRSLRAAEGFDCRIGCLDLGLNPETRQNLAGFVDHIVRPEWPFKPHPVFGARPVDLSRAARPFLPAYFPGHETYIWIDSDCWVQKGDALKGLILASSQGAAAVVPAVDRSYFHSSKARQWLYERYRMALGEEEAKQLILFSYINSGVFALQSNAPHWRAWELRFQKALDQWQGDFLSDQAIMNALIYLDRLPAVLLPSEYNWICHLALPMWAPRHKCFVGPNFPWPPLGIIHNTFDNKQNAVRIQSATGPVIETKLTYDAYLALKDMADGSRTAARA